MNRKMNLKGLTALFLKHERKPAVRIRGYVEEVVANSSDDRFKRNFRLSRDTFEEGPLCL